jgi:hypothetical protein
MIDRDELMAMCGRDAPDPEPDTWAEEEASAREICGEISLEGSRFCVLDVGHSGPHAYATAAAAALAVAVFAFLMSSV